MLVRSHQSDRAARAWSATQVLGRMSFEIDSNCDQEWRQLRPGGLERVQISTEISLSPEALIDFPSSYAQLPSRLVSMYPELAKNAPRDTRGNAERLVALTTVLGGRKLGHVVDLGGHSGFFCLSLIASGLAEFATVYDASKAALEAGRSMANLMGISHRIVFKKRKLDLQFVRLLPRADTFMCLNLLHHAGATFDKEIVQKLGWDAYAVEWLSAIREKAPLAIFGIGFTEYKPKFWKASARDRVAILARLTAEAGWSLRYDANVKDIGDLGVEAADGLYTRHGKKHKPWMQPSKARKWAASFAHAARFHGLEKLIIDRRRKYHLYILERENPGQSGAEFKRLGPRPKRHQEGRQQKEVAALAARYAASEG